MCLVQDFSFEILVDRREYKLLLNMVAWTVFLVFVLVILIFMILQKIYNEHKIKAAQRNLVGKVKILF